ncbi:threonine transporter [Bordetella hinzii]|nr:threonine transporter [Bordetella hinzii]
MDGIMSQERKPITFNGPLEAGIRAVSILGAAFPKTYDLQRLVALDYLLVHTGDIDGPDNLHPPTPMHSAELLVRRKLIEQSLLLMMTRDLVEREITPDGIKYGAGESAETFLSSVSSSYLLALKDRASWLVETLGDLTDEQFKGVMRRFFDKWVEEFQQVERSLGGEV